MGRALEEERHVDRNHQPVPLAVCQVKILQKQDSARNALVLRATLSLKKNSARVARANQPAIGWFDQVFMLYGEFEAAHFAALYCRPFAGKPAKGRERAFLLKWNRGRHLSPRSSELAQRTKRSLPGHSPVAPKTQTQNASAPHRSLPQQWM